MPIYLLNVKTHLVTIDFFANCAHNYDDYVNIPNDSVNTTTNLANMPNISSLNLCIPNPPLLQLLLICRLKIKIVFIVGSVIYSLSLAFFIYGFYISHPSLSSLVSKFASELHLHSIPNILAFVFFFFF
jgi:hypothetical protein